MGRMVGRRFRPRFEPATASEEVADDSLQPAGFGSIFAVLFATAILSHVANQGATGRLLGTPAISDPWYWLVLVAAAAVLLRPRSGALLGFAALACVMAVAGQAPNLANHWLLAGLLAATIVVSVVRTRSGLRPASSDTIVSDAAPALRTVFLIAYSAAAIAKLNTTFLDPAHSCAVSLATTVAGFWGLPAPEAPGTLRLLIAMTVIAELAVPVLLLVPRTRAFGIVFTMGLHLVMSNSGDVYVLDFHAFVTACLALFAAASFTDQWAQLRRAMDRQAPHALKVLRSRLTQVGIPVVLVAYLGFRGDLVGQDGFPGLTWFLLLLWWGSVFVATTVALWRSRSKDAQRPKVPSARSLGHGLIIALLALNVASPYIGLKTMNSFTMFSNLRTELGESNHLFLPRLEVFDVQDDFVAIIEADDSYLAAFADSGQLIHMSTVRNRLAADPDQGIHLVRGEQVIEVDQASDMPDLVTPNWAERHLMHYRPLHVSGVQPCRA